MRPGRFRAHRGRRSITGPGIHSHVSGAPSRLCHPWPAPWSRHPDPARYQYENSRTTTIRSAASEFEETELAELVWLITTINAWNRVNVAAHVWPVN